AGDLGNIGLGIQAHFEDFDNDTFVDILVTGRSGEDRLLMNNGDGTFTNEVDRFPSGNLAMQSAAIGDLNDDGFPDIIGGFASGFNNPSNNPDQLFINPGNENNYVKVRLTGTESNPAAVGARVEVVGAWGSQMRDVIAGEGYGISNSLITHFGLGATDEIESIIVHWPSGNVDTVEAPLANQTVHVIEGCANTYFEDADGDGFGNPMVQATGCEAPEGYVEDGTDCDDMDGNNFPDNPEACDQADNNCNDEIDEGLDMCLPPGASTGEPPGDDTTGVISGSGSGTADETGGDAGATEDDSGCGCVVTSHDRGTGMMLLWLGVLAGIRRRRRSARSAN
ncbi:MAG: ASPIC/UnbV domain-containing protein, partial [Deltaproteobacteria bacterium]|nr:ASPIC/UnbV domain-containing protein [Deltaproteobacteria bacterium]